MGLFSPLPNGFRKMDEEEFVQESLEMFDIRTKMEHILNVLSFQKKGVAASDYQPKFNDQKANYTVDETIDASHFSEHKTIQIRITPIAEFGDRSFKFKNELFIDGRQIPERKVEEKFREQYIWLRHYINRMDKTFEENERTRGWKGINKGR